MDIGTLDSLRGGGVRIEQVARAVRETLPNGQAVIIPGAGHAITFDAVAEANRRALEFLIAGDELTRAR